MRIQAPLVVEMTDEQAEDYAAEFRLTAPDGGKPRARDIVDHVRSWLLSDLQGGRLGDFADITIKR